MTITIGQHMTEFPHSVGAQQPLPRAVAFMREYKVRHLPVLHGGTLVGMLSDRDVMLLESLGDALQEGLAVEEVMSANPYAVSPEEPLVNVLQTMAARKLGAAVVLEGGRVVGIYTSTDAVRTLAENMANQTP